MRIKAILTERRMRKATGLQLQTAAREAGLPEYALHIREVHMENVVAITVEGLDQEWVALIVEAMQAGMDPKEIQEFFRSHSIRSKE